MGKNIIGILWIGFWVFSVDLKAEQILALLKGIENNHTLHMSYKQQAFVCKPFGIETVSELVERVDVNSSCMGYLREFRRAHPKEKVFAFLTLRPQQQYSVEGKEHACLLSLSSGHSYSEALLEQGYARLPEAFVYKDFLLRHRFNRALQRAKNTKAGIWSDTNIRNCFLVSKEKK